MSEVNKLINDLIVNKSLETEEQIYKFTEIIDELYKVGDSSIIARLCSCLEDETE